MGASLPSEVTVLSRHNLKRRVCNYPVMLGTCMSSATKANKLLACENMTTGSRMHLITIVKKYLVDSVD